MIDRAVIRVALAVAGVIPVAAVLVVVAAAGVPAVAAAAIGAATPLAIAAAYFLLSARQIRPRRPLAAHNG
jgi:hypothetical protein